MSNRFAKAMSEPRPADIPLPLTFDEAVVLFEFLQRYSNTDRLTIEDQAEQRTLWNLSCMFEKHVTIPIGRNYADLLAEARDRLRDEA
jgi:hypothetical protein